WLVPHFEKMLYDNALLTGAYIEAYQLTGEDKYRDTATETLDYVAREMTLPEGGFYSATDADSEGVEGKFFVWTPQEIEEILGSHDAKLFNAYYDIAEGGNWEGKSIPNTPRPLTDLAVQFDQAPETLRRRLDEYRKRVYEARSARVPPGLDDKILTAWNGMMIGAFARAYRVFRNDRYLDIAKRAADFLLTSLVREDGGLLRTYRNGKAHLNAYLEDYAFVSEALIDLYESGGDTRYLREAERLLDRTLTEFLDSESGAFFNTAADHEELLMRFRDGTDDAVPASNATVASALVRMSHHADRDDFRIAAIRAIRAYGGMMARHPRAFAKSLNVVDLLLEGPVELALVGTPGTPDLEALRAEVARHFLPNRVEAVVDPERANDDAALPLERGKSLVNGKAALYICRNYTCLAPITDLDEVRTALGTAEGGLSEQVISSPVEGSATATGTSRYRERFGDRGYRSFGTTGWSTSIIGFGGYRVTDGIPEHREALTRAVLSGVNLIDTSTNYMDGGSERLVGSVLRELIEGGEVLRDEIVVVSKIGYVQGENHAIAVKREEEGRPYPEMVKIQEGLWHCIHPEFLADQFQRSLDRLELETLDVCLLHNPEYFLSAAAVARQPLVKARDEFYRRVGAAFTFFEDQVAAGRLRWYGVSSNTATAPTTASESVSVSRVLDTAVAVGGTQHHCKVFQLPLNLYETGALSERNTGPNRGKSALEMAREKELAVMVNRPLNAFTSDGVLRLADVPLVDDDVDWDVQLDRVGKLEESFRDQIASSIDAPDDGPVATDYFRWSDRLPALRRQQPGLEEWGQTEGQISYTVARVAATLDRDLTGDAAERWTSWRMRYFPELNKLMRAMRVASIADANRRGAEVVAQIDPMLPDERKNETLSRKALWVVASTPGVTCVLNGMRTVEYVRDALGVMAWEPLDDVQQVYEVVK
ncbi:MAG: aldo/keto reductase, partial [Gemmatimonadales bacterium]